MKTEKKKSVFDFLVEEDAEYVEYWLQDHPDQVDMKDDTGWGLLHLACCRGLFSMVKLIVEHGADIELLDPDGWTPLHHLAEFNQNQEILSYLIEKGVDLDAKDKYGSTALHYAVRNHAFEMVRQLVECGANLDAEDDSNRSVLDEAEYASAFKIVTYLEQVMTAKKEHQELEDVTAIVKGSEPTEHRKRQL